ncbi:hypothetical protein MJO28_006175 [Puccinia striiformis f. sp. tritici]|uniref:Uncharacterized protein n=2 Tax=Puccinia striiformis TaxID=27350 RepID=A0A2S4UF01_9BASI|nr:hypothetical protein MJO28_006175 [Puccinia striiformis f. sp. tritici]POV95724.1 hypothetical protein PSTT_16097 [Puccinia striiformis]
MACASQHSTCVWSTRAHHPSCCAYLTPVWLLNRPHPQPISQPTSQATNLLPPHPHTTTPSSNQSNHTDMSKPPPLPPDIPPTTTTVTPATTGVTVPLDVWAQMQHFMATFAPLALAPSKPSLPIGTVLLSEPSPTLTPPTITPLAPEPTDQSAIALNSSSPPSPTIPGLDELWKDVEADDPHDKDDSTQLVVNSSLDQQIKPDTQPQMGSSKLVLITDLD